VKESGTDGFCRKDKTAAAATDGTGNAARNVVSDERDHTSCGDSRTRVAESENSFSPADWQLNREANLFGNTARTKFSRELAALN
jgi:hypothetical protein